MPYTIPPGDSLTFVFTEGGYAPPTGNALFFNFADVNGDFIYPQGIAPRAFGTPTVVLGQQVAAPAGINESAFGSPSVERPPAQTLEASGFESLEFGAQGIANAGQAYPPGIAPAHAWRGFPWTTDGSYRDDYLARSVGSWFPGSNPYNLLYGTPFPDKPIISGQDIYDAGEDGEFSFASSVTTFITQSETSVRYSLDVWKASTRHSYVEELNPDDVDKEFYREFEALNGKLFALDLDNELFSFPGIDDPVATNGPFLTITKADGALFLLLDQTFGNNVLKLTPNGGGFTETLLPYTGDPITELRGDRVGNKLWANQGGQLKVLSTSDLSELEAVTLPDAGVINALGALSGNCLIAVGDNALGVNSRLYLHTPTGVQTVFVPPYPARTFNAPLTDRRITAISTRYGVFGVGVDRFGDYQTFSTTSVPPSPLPDWPFYGNRLIYTPAGQLRLIGGPHDFEHRVYRKRNPVTPAGINAVRFGTTDVELYNRALLVSGFNAARFGTAAATHRIREIQPQGTSFNARGTPTVSLRIRYISLSGFGGEAFGFQQIYNYDPTQYVSVQGIAQPASEPPTVWNYLSYLYPVGAESAADVSRFLSVENRNRVLEAFGIPPGPIGTPALEERLGIEFRPSSIPPGGIGTQIVFNVTQYLGAQGFDSGIVSDYAAAAIDDSNLLRPSGLINEAYGTPSLRYGQFFVQLANRGILGTQIDDPTVTFGRRPVYPSAFDASDFGDAQLTASLRYIAVPSILAGGVGSPDIEYRVRLIGAQAFTNTLFGYPTLGYAREIAPSGYDAAMFGTAYLEDNRRFAGPTGIGPGAFGITGFDFYTKTLGAQTAGDQTSFGGARLYNLRQILYPFTDNPLTWGPYFGNFNSIENRSRFVRPFGFDASKVPLGAYIENAARAVYPASYDASAVAGASLVAYRVRYITPPGQEAPYISGWHVVYNAARVVSASGASSDAIGTADVRNVNRTLSQFFPYEGEAFGLPFVADAIRTISFYQGIPPETIFGPTVYNLTQRIAPQGFDWPDETGAHAVYEHFNIIAPRFNYQDRLGFPTVLNLTPELGALGYEQTIFGTSSIRLQYRFVYPQGSLMELYGRTTIKDRTQRTEVTGLLSQSVSRFARVELGNPFLPFPQTVEADGFDIDETQVGAPRIRTNVLYPSGFNAAFLGSPTLYSYGIQVPSIPLDFSTQVGIPAVNPTQFIFARDIDPPMPSFSQTAGPNSHRVTHHTIWASFDAPGQAIRNHGGRRWEYMDAPANGDNGERPFFGTPFVSNRHRSVRVLGGIPRGDVGTPALSNKIRTVSPTGFYSWKYGVAELFGGSRSFEAFGFDMADYGAPVVEHYEEPNTTRSISVPGAVRTAFGTTRVENFNRTVSVQGFSPSVVQRPAQVSRAPRFLTPAGRDNSLFGTAEFSFYIRYVQTQGDDMALLEYGAGSFSDRLRVRSRKAYSIGGINFAALGTPTVAARNRTVYQTDEIPVGMVGLPACSARNIVALGGFGLEAGAFGDIDRWEAGKVKAHGDDLARYGLPRLDRVINTVGVNGEFGSARVGRSLWIAGIDAFEAGSPATPLTNPHGCGSNPRAVVPHQFLGSGVGAPSVQ